MALWGELQARAEAPVKPTTKVKAVVKVDPLPKLRSAKPAEAAKPAAPAKPAEAAKPAAPAKSAEAGKPAETTAKPASPSKDVAKAREAAKGCPPDDLMCLMRAGKKPVLAKPAEAAKPAETTAKPAAPSKDAAKPTEAVKNCRPGDPTCEVSESAKSRAMPAEAVKPAETAAKTTTPKTLEGAKPKCKAGMVAIPAGVLTRTPDGYADLKRRKKLTEQFGGVGADVTMQVSIAGFCMDLTEVTIAAYARCIRSGKCEQGAAHDGETLKGLLKNITARENYPITFVQRGHADEYCATQKLRLPTLDEWEYAARGADGRIYTWGNEKPTNQLCWKSKNTCAVGSHPKDKSPFGILDMAGNVAEWTSDTGGHYGYNPYLAGGYWETDHPSIVRGDTRADNDPTYSSELVGFRCADSPLKDIYNDL